MLGQEATPFSADHVAERARLLAARPYAAASTELPRVLRGLTYDYRAIEFDRAQALWASEGLPFQVQPFHRGFVPEQRVALYDVADGVAARFGSVASSSATASVCRRRPTWTLASRVRA